MTSAAESVQLFDWKPQPAGQQLVNELLADFLGRCPQAASLASAMKAAAGTRFHDWVDHIAAPRTQALKERLLETGFTQHAQPGAADCFIHEGAMFPAVLLVDGQATRVGIKVDSVADFCAVHQLCPKEHPIEGAPFGQYRQVRAFSGEHAELWAIERHGYRGFTPPTLDAAKLVKSQQHLENLRRRRRDFGVGAQADAQGFAHADALIDAAIADLGRDWACDLFFAAERDYWQRRNRAARVQKARQDTLGLGWANHDHHTYRCSRAQHKTLIAFLEKLGFHCRERFYAGAEAGWGAQVIEQPVAGITIFADVDMSPEELLGDFSHVGLPPRDKAKGVGTIGLWCELHGEAFLQAGMHHLECQFDWHALKDQLQAEAGIKTMDPFTTFPFLRQAFTEGERWTVKPERLAAAVSNGYITQQQAEQFAKQGVIGSHLENLERNDGFKGFNQQGVSDIIERTDPRKHAAVSA